MTTGRAVKLVILGGLGLFLIWVVSGVVMIKIAKDYPHLLVSQEVIDKTKRDYPAMVEAAKRRQEAEEAQRKNEERQRQAEQQK